MSMPTERMKLVRSVIYEREGVCSVTEGIEKNYFGCFNDGANWRQLLFWLGKSFVASSLDISSAFYFHGMTTCFMGVI